MILDRCLVRVEKDVELASGESKIGEPYSFPAEEYERKILK